MRKEEFQKMVDQSLEKGFEKNNDALFLRMKEFFTVTMTQAFSDFGREMRDFVRQENRAMKQEILLGVGEMISGNIVPQLDDHDHRLLKLERKAL